MKIRTSLREYWFCPVLVYSLVCTPALTWYLTASNQHRAVCAIVLFLAGLLSTATILFLQLRSYYLVDKDGITYCSYQGKIHLHWDEFRYIGVTERNNHPWFCCSVDALHTYQPTAPQWQGSTGFSFRYDLLSAHTQEKLRHLCGGFRDLPQEEQPPHPLRTLVLRPSADLVSFLSAIVPLLFAGLIIFVLLPADRPIRDTLPTFAGIAIISELLLIPLWNSVRNPYFTIQQDSISIYRADGSSRIFWDDCRFIGILNFPEGRAPVAHYVFSPPSRPNIPDALPGTPFWPYRGTVSIPLGYLDSESTTYLMSLCGGERNIPPDPPND